MVHVLRATNNWNSETLSGVTEVPRLCYQAQCMEVVNGSFIPPCHVTILVSTRILDDSKDNSSIQLILMVIRYVAAFTLY